MNLSPEQMKYTRIGVAAGLMLAVVFVVGFVVLGGRSEAVVGHTESQPKPKLPFEAGVFSRLEKPFDTKTLAMEKNAKRSLAVYYSRRAYAGAPPVIPHKILDPASWGAQSCNNCHADGGWAPEFQAYTPVTPHPEFLSCRQCHVPAEAKTVFRETRFEPLKPAIIPKGALKTAPPPIPHALDMRANCVACHGGPAAVAELRTTHPERINCRQCHALNDARTAESAGVFQRPGYDGGAR